MITKYGLSVVLWSSGICLTGIGASLMLLEQDGLRYGVIFFFLLVLGFVLNFFRDPDRAAPSGDGIIISPADGRVCLIKELFEGEYLVRDAVQVSVFMSPLNVHVNRFPVSGTVGYFKHIPGEYLVAFDDKSSERNERTHIGIDAGGWKILFKQIAGTIARRIIADLTVGQKATAGERFGMIRFGSRVDVIMPKGTVVRVSLGQHVVAGETILAEYRQEKGAALGAKHPTDENRI